MKFGSVCSGIEAASVAWGPLGWKAQFVSEIDAFPRALLAHRYPHVPNLGDMNTFQEWPDADLDLLCGGTPCQSYSLAGLRKGLGDPRGNLMLVFGAIAAKYRPRWLVWENVPGVLSSHGGRDFAAFLGLLTGQKVEPPAGGWQRAGFLGGIDSAYGVAWRVLDAQYFGLAQRRERVFVVGYLGDWRAAAAVLLEREGLRGDPAPSRGQGKDAARSVAPSLDASYGRLQGTSGQDLNHGHGHLTVGTLRATDGGVDVTHAEVGHLVFGGNNTAGPIDVAPGVRAHGSFHGDFETEALIAGTVRTHTRPGSDTVGSIIPLLKVNKRTGRNYENMRDGMGVGAAGDPSFTLQANAQHGVLAPMVFQERGRPDGRNLEVGGDTAYALSAAGGEGGRRSDMNVLAPLPFPSQMSGTQTGGQDTGTSQTINAKSRMGVAAPLAFSVKDHGQDAGEVSPTLRAGGHDKSHANGGVMPGVAGAMGVRRFTPLECELLQGLPRHYTLIPYRPRRPKDFDEWYAYLRWHIAALTGDEAGMLAADGPRYKAIGNTWAIPCVRWIGQRIDLVDAIIKEAA